MNTTRAGDAAVADARGHAWRRHPWVHVGLVCLTAVCSSPSHGQQTEGNLVGKAPPGAHIALVNVSNGQTRGTTADAQGRFFVSRLAPGRYRVSAAAVSSEVLVALGGTAEVALLPESLDAVLVEGRGRTALDVRSVENASVFTAEQMERLPIERDIQSAAQLAPGVSPSTVLASDTARSNLPVISGASAAENAYFINGMDVTDLRTMLSYATVPFDGIAQQQVKTGSYGAEFGRSLGGVLSVVTKRGTNQWTGGMSATWSPDVLRATGTDIVDLTKEAASPLTQKPNYVSFVSGNRADDMSAAAYGGGPLMRNVLFVYGALQTRRDRRDRFGATSSTALRNGGPVDALIKVDFTPSEHHAVEFTALRARQREGATYYDHAKLAGAPAGTPTAQLIDDRWFATQHVGGTAGNVFVSKTDVLIGRYNGYVNERFSWSMMAGRVKVQPSQNLNTPDIANDCPVVFLPGLVQLGCAVVANGPRQRDPNAPRFDRDRRLTYRIDAEYIAGNHTLRWGYDAVRFFSARAGTALVGGGSLWTYINGGTGALPRLVPPGQQYVRETYSVTESGVYDVRNSAAYIEDNWKLSERWTVYAGLRNESFANSDGAGVTFLKVQNSLAPRLGAVWDVHGDASLRVYGSAGRYHIPLPSATNTQLTRGSAAYTAYYTFTGRDPRTGVPIGLSAPTGESGSRSLVRPDPATVASPSLRPMSQDEWSLGFEQLMDTHWTLGARATVRRVNDGIDTYCSAYGLKQWAIAQGYSQYRAAASPPCLLVNPGRDVQAKLDLNNNGVLSPVTIPADYIGLPQYKRSYRAVELTLERRFTTQVSLGASYVWSVTRGNVEGYVQSGGSGDAAVTAVFDFASLTAGADGRLPNDRRHVLKVYGHVQPAPHWRVGWNLLMRSGTPTSCNGYVPSTAADYRAVDSRAGLSGYAPLSFYCLGDDKRTQLTQRGSQGDLPWNYNADINMAYTPKLASGRLVLQATVFNVFNSQQRLSVDQTPDFSRANVDLQNSVDPALRDSVRFNPNYRQPKTLQSPRYVQISLRFEM